MIKYDSYKDSGIEWLGEIPEHWSLKRNKDISFINAISLDNNTNPLYEFRYIDISNVNQNGIINEPEQISFIESPSRARRVLKENDVIVSTVRTYLRAVAFINFDPKDYIVSTGFAVLSPLKIINPTYLAYYCQSDFFIDLVIKNSKGVSYPAINATELACLSNLFPPNQEQSAIAQYLDTKTQAIDKKVNLLEKKIGYFKELRKSIINETVTKGLDKSAALQVNDLGFETPSPWSKKRLKDVGFLYSGLSGKSGDDFNQDDNPNNKGFIPFTNIANNTYLKKDHLGTVVVFDGEKQNKVKEGDIFFLMSSEGYEDIGKSAVLAENIDDTYLNSFCKGFRIKQKNCNPYFLNYLLLSDYYRQILIIEGKGFTRINLKMEKVNDFEVYLPKNISEQSDIVTYLDHKTQTIEKIVGNIQNQIITLKELRKTLINDVVTGKIKVVE
ncbi:MAG: restriction endonuclease subunit S [Bacteroidetes bacterium]|nr:restriction endonuclease subunit S [Bacteroidota bacterium]